MKKKSYASHAALKPLTARQKKLLRLAVIADEVAAAQEFLFMRSIEADNIHASL